MYKLFKNGTIHTLNPSQPKVSALLEAKGRIVFCGSEKDINLPAKLLNTIKIVITGS